MVKVNGWRFAAEVLEGNARINLTQMSQPFGRSCRPGNWLKTDEAQRYLHAISVATKIATADLLEVRQGGDPLEQGTWCRDYRIALRFAQWLSPEFSIKVDEAILGLLAAGPAAGGVAPLRMGASATNPQAMGRLPIPRERSADLGEFYSELRKWVLKEDEAAVAELAGVGVAHVREVLAGRKPGYGVLCLLVEYATENRAAGRMRVVRSAARRAEQVEELRLDFMTASRGSEWHVGIQPTCDKLTGSVGCERGAMGSAAEEPQNRANRVAPEANGPTGTACERGATGASGGCDPLRKGASAAGSACPEVVLRPEGRRTAGSHETGHDVTDGIIDFNGMEG